MTPGPDPDEQPPDGGATERPERRTPDRALQLTEPPASLTGLRPRWVGAFVAGELFGFIPPAVTGSVLGAVNVSDLVMVLGLTAAGSLEGAALGLTQAWVLKRHVPAIVSRDWVIATALAAAFAWFVGMSGASILGSQLEPAWVFALMLGPAWLAALLGMGFAQWIVLRRVIPKSRSWIPVTAAAWFVGVMVPVVALSVIPDSWPMAARAVTAVVAAIAMGVAVGSITGLALHRILTRAAAAPI